MGSLGLADVLVSTALSVLTLENVRTLSNNTSQTLKDSLRYPRGTLPKVGRKWHPRVVARFHCSRGLFIKG